MEFTKHKITEAVCAFRFDPIQNPWDITIFSNFYDSVKDDGFIKKQEIKPFQLSFQIKSDEEPKPPNFQQGETQMVFKTDDEKYAILIGNNYVSFHTLNHYPGWDMFKPKIIEVCLRKYFALGLGKGLANVQMIYINNFDLEANKDLSDYLTFVPKMKDFGEGEETTHHFQSNYFIAPNKQLSLRTILSVLPPHKIKKVLLESNCIASNINGSEWSALADDAHDAARNAFIKISSDYFKGLIK